MLSPMQTTLHRANCRFPSPAHSGVSACVAMRLAVFHVPGDPAIVQTHTWPPWSVTVSPSRYVPDNGGPDTVAPAARMPAVDPVRPVTDRSGTGGSSARNDD